MSQAIICGLRVIEKPRGRGRREEVIQMSTRERKPMLIGKWRESRTIFLNVNINFGRGLNVHVSKLVQKGKGSQISVHMVYG